MRERGQKGYDSGSYDIRKFIKNISKLRRDSLLPSLPSKYDIWQKRSEITQK